MQTRSPESASRDAQDRRCLARTALPVAEKDNWCSLRTGTGESATARVLDITTEGCRLEIAASPQALCLARLQQGDWLEFQDWTCSFWHAPLAGLRAEVVWAEGRELGCRFERRLSAAEIGSGRVTASA